MWYLTPDTWHVTHDICHMTHRGWWPLCQNFKSLALQFGHNDVLKIWRKRSLTDWMNESINDKGVYRTAPATPGQGNMVYITSYFFFIFFCKQNVWHRRLCWNHYPSIHPGGRKNKFHQFVLSIHINRGLAVRVAILRSLLSIWLSYFWFWGYCEHQNLK